MLCVLSVKELSIESIYFKKPSSFYQVSGVTLTVVLAHVIITVLSFPDFFFFLIKLQEHCIKNARYRRVYKNQNFLFNRTHL